MYILLNWTTGSDLELNHRHTSYLGGVGGGGERRGGGHGSPAGEEEGRMICSSGLVTVPSTRLWMRPRRVIYIRPLRAPLIGWRNDTQPPGSDGHIFPPYQFNRTEISRRASTPGFLWQAAPSFFSRYQCIYYLVKILLKWFILVIHCLFSPFYFTKQKQIPTDFVNKNISYVVVVNKIFCCY
jgi:hypothetical protein